MVTDYPLVRDTALDERNRAGWLRWADAYARDERPRDLRTMAERAEGWRLEARARGLRAYAARLHAARFHDGKVVSITLGRSR